MLEMHEDAHSDRKSFSSTVVIMMFLMFTYDSACFFFSIFMRVEYPQQIKSIRMQPHYNYLGFPGGESSISRNKQSYDPAFSRNLCS